MKLPTFSLLGIRLPLRLADANGRNVEDADGKLVFFGAPTGSAMDDHDIAAALVAAVNLAAAGQIAPHLREVA